MKVSRARAEPTISLNTFWVGPGSLKVHPSMAMTVFRAGLFLLRLVNLENRDPEMPSMGAMLYESGVIDEK